MPLKSRGTALRAAREEAQSTPEVESGEAVTIAPRRDMPPQPAPDPKPEAPATGDAPAPEAPKQRKKRADTGVKRAPKAAAPVATGDTPTPTAIRSRQREIEVQYKELLRQQALEEKELRAKHVDARNTLMREHTQLGGQLSKLLFKA